MSSFDGAREQWENYHLGKIKEKPQNMQHIRMFFCPKAQNYFSQHAKNKNKQHRI